MKSRTHREIVDLRLCQLFEPLRRIHPACRKLRRDDPVRRRILLLFRLQLHQQSVSVLHLSQLPRRLGTEGDHLFQRLPILPLQPIQRRQPVFNLLQPPWSSVNIVGKVAHLGVDILHNRLRRRQLLCGLLKSHVIPRQLFQVLQRRTQGALGRALRLIQQLMRAHRRGIKLLRVSQHALLCLKLNVLILRGQRSLIDLLALKPPEVSHSQPILLRRLQLLQLVRRGPPGGVRFSNTICTQPAKTIQQTPLLRLIERIQCLPLRMHQRKLRRKLPQNTHRRRLIVDEYSSFAVRDDLAPQQNMV